MKDPFVGLRQVTSNVGLLLLSLAFRHKPPARPK